MTPHQPHDLPPLGSPSFTPLLLRHVLSHPALAGWSINPSLFSVLLLAMIVRKGGVVVDTTKRDIDDLAQVIHQMIGMIFGLRVHHISFDEYTDPEEVIHRLCHGRAHNPFISGSTQQQHDQRTDPDGMEVLIMTGLEDASSPVKVKIGDMMTKKRIEVPSGDDYGTMQRNGDGELSDGKMERKFDPLVVWIREEGREVPSWMIDQFMLGLHIHSDDIELPPSDFGTITGQGAIIPSTYISQLTSLLPYVHIHAPLRIHLSNLLSAVSSHPGLRTNMTGKATRGIREYIKAHRLLSGSFEIPYSFLHPYSSDETDLSARGKGLGGGIGGVDTWAELAGEEPSLSKYSSETEGMVDEPYCTPGNVEGVWKVFVGHRCRCREEREEVMWLIKGSAVGGDPEGRLVKGNKRKGVDKTLDEILRTV
ncbi:hypothetical protein I302_107994 [Kwoniella bestiolae CBS 10118]|uniref:Uncharacterized protein n=1 Tax=Kwoniella bestiolae CBS 10118 TaxID=1296100 RepID=A0A1B9FWY8_9TREE|nr:hypothetical protein I302_07641 [Kwoniella bestiolae CBS 10118]OCF23287.1 hypothetical protein I302_07641 [Kwoniella bestiolae CBS 10118]